MKALVRITMLVAVAGAAILLPVGAAQADIVMNTSLSGPSGAGVGATNLAGSFTVQNSNTPPQQADTLTIGVLRLAPSCAAVRSGSTVCPSPDPGVYSLASTASGAVGTACAGITFSASAPDATGAVSLTPSSAVVLQGPGGADRCTVNFFVSVIKVPGVDVDLGAPGIQTWTNLYVQATSSPSHLTISGGVSLESTVNPGIPGLSTIASRSTGMVSDTATLTAAGSGPRPTGTVTFRVYGPNDSSCTGAPQTATQSITNGIATATFPAHTSGVYRFTAGYSGDRNYMSRLAQCNDPGESVTVVIRSQRDDFDGDGKSDIAVFHPPTGVWTINNSGGGTTTTTLGVNGDIPVPGDYNGDGKTDIAVFHPPTGLWTINNSGGGTTTTTLGGNGDIPTPGDYNGDGKTDVAVFRPSSGTWYINLSGGGSTTTGWGAPGDKPVPGDYDGDGKTDLAVYRPSTGTWYVLLSGGGSTATVFGAPTDIPVVGDYNGDGKADLTIFRPSTGTWHVLFSGGHGTAPVWGAPGDIPVAGDFNGDGKSDETVFRPSSGIWYVLLSSGGYTTTSLGSAGDKPIGQGPGT